MPTSSSRCEEEYKIEKEGAVATTDGNLANSATGTATAANHASTTTITDVGPYQSHTDTADRGLGDRE